MFKVRVEGKETFFNNFNEIDTFLERKGYKRIVGNWNQWCVGKLLRLGNKEQFYICGSIRDDENKEIKVLKD